MLGKPLTCGLYNLPVDKISSHRACTKMISSADVALWCSASLLQRSIGKVLRPSIEAAKFCGESEAEISQLREQLERLKGASRNDADIEIYTKSGRVAGFYRVFLIEQSDLKEEQTKQLDPFFAAAQREVGITTIVMLVQDVSDERGGVEAFMQLQNRSVTPSQSTNNS